MFRRNRLPVWIGIIALSGMFLMGEDAWPPCIDVDSDGYGFPASVTCPHYQQDCDDSNPYIYPGAPELCDWLDNQCPGDAGYGEVDEGCTEPGMARIPEGAFVMGDFFGEGFSDELPLHLVMISEFQMDIYEVINAQYAGCVGAEACTPP